MSKIVFIGGGSAKFVREVTVDLFSYSALSNVEIMLMDIDQERVERSERLVRRMIQELRLEAAVNSTTDRRKALEGADYVIVTIMVGGYEHYYTDVAIPAKYGVFQTVSDTIGPGGVMRTLRTAPILQALASDLKEIAPNAWLLNYANPMAMNVRTLSLSGQERVVGLCHSIQHSYRAIAKWLEVPADEVVYTAGGINHVDFYLRLEHRGRDLYPELLARSKEIIEKNPGERARFEILQYLGYWPAEGPYHQSEYYPWFRKNQELVEHYAAPTFWGYEVDVANFRNRTEEIEAQISGKSPISYQRSLEYGASIINALETGELFPFYGNVPNNGLISNLPKYASVEVPCCADKTGIVAGAVGEIPLQLAAVMQPHIAVHELAVRGTLLKDRTMIRQAIQADPLTSAILTLSQIEAMTNELLAENSDYLAGW